MSIGRRMDKKAVWYIYTVEYYSAVEFILISSNEVDETGAHYTQWNKSEKTPTDTVY